MRTKPVNAKRLAGLLLTLLSALLVYANRQPLQSAASQLDVSKLADYTVTEVVDGDTIKVLISGHIETVRYIGIDTPETHDPRKSVQCYGQAAAAKNKEWVGGKQVRLEADPNDSDRDKYGRLLRYVYVGDELINAKLVREGYAFAYVVFPFERLDEFRALEQSARASGKGLWGSCRVDETKAIKQTNDQT